MRRYHLLLTVVFAVCLWTTSSATLQQGSEFDVSTAVRGFTYSRSTSCETPAILRWNCGEACRSVPGFKPYALHDNTNAGTLAFTGADPSRREIVVAFRASSNLKNWIANLKFFPVPLPTSYGPCRGIKGEACEVHKGFLHSYETLRSRIRADVAALRMAYPTFDVFVTGHSLGGAMAELCALDLTTMLAGSAADRATPRIDRVADEVNATDGEATPLVGNAADALLGLGNAVTDRKDSYESQQVPAQASQAFPSSADSADSTTTTIRNIRNSPLSGALYTNNTAPSIRVYTYGAPRIGNRPLAYWATLTLWDRAKGRQLFRVTHARDPVPHLPPLSFSFLHPATEVYYPDRDVKDLFKFRTCDDTGLQESRHCSNDVLPTVTKDHLFFMGSCSTCDCTGRAYGQKAEDDFSLTWSEYGHILKESVSNRL